ncbi:hypothetical protein C4J65_00215 [Streptomyces sp. CB09001]|nr:hypothetical protein C4J65_00215 [Streptomyces sp. CB09001]
MPGEPRDPRARLSGFPSPARGTPAGGGTARRRRPPLARCLDDGEAGITATKGWRVAREEP